MTRLVVKRGKVFRVELGGVIPCPCGVDILVDGFWLAAHWHESLSRVCDVCQRRYTLRSGRVTLTGRTRAAVTR